MELLIKNVRIVDCSMDFTGDIYIKHGKIVCIGNNIDIDATIVDGKNFVAMPSFIDMHSHFRDPGFTYKEDLMTGSKAAAKGGYTAVNLMGNTKPICSHKDILSYIKKKAKKLDIVDVLQCVTITEDFDGKTISHLDLFDKNEIVAISDDGKGVADSKVMMDAMIKAKKNDWLIISHAEDSEFTNTDMRIAENMMTLRDVTLSGITNAKLHMAHVSTKEAMQYIIDAKRKYYNVSCEVTPHHIFLTSKECNYRVNPPIRQKEDVEYLIKAIKDGYVDAIGTDHAPHSEEDKEKGAPGMIGLETSFSVCYTALVKNHDVSLKKLSYLMSGRPSELLKLNKGRISPGYDGDIVLVDIDKQYQVTKDSFVSKSSNSPFIGMNLYGKVLMTIKGGKITYSDMEE